MLYHGAVSVEHKVLDALGRAMGRFSMLRPGDKVAVGVSGGKDSLSLLHAMVAYRKRAPFPYEMVAVTVEQGKFKLPIDALGEKIRSLGVEWILREDRATLDLIAQGIPHGCDVCSRHRRFHLYQIASELDCSVLALGHTADDCAESLMRNILFNGRIASLPPVAQSQKGHLRLIRPLVYVTEDLSAEYARAQGFLAIGCVCGEKESVRKEIRVFLDDMKSRHPGIPASVTAALANVNPHMLFDRTLRDFDAENLPVELELDTNP
jgi:tRNA 2-thiocytidine biosynthesis protein TtcA